MSRIAVLVEHSENGRLLADFLGRQYELAVSEGDFDLGIVDEPTLRQREGWIREKRAGETGFLPFLLILGTDRGEETLNERVWACADDVIRSPVQKAVLLRRVANLLRLRDQSILLRDQNEALVQRYEEEKALRLQITDQKVSLERLNDQKTQWLGTAAHDLRTPLGLIALYSDFLVEESGLPIVEQRDFIDKIQSSSRYMQQLIDDMLDLSSIESGQLDLCLQAVDLRGLVRRNAELNKILAAHKDIELECSDEGRAVYALADPMRLEQVLNNLVGNAIKYSEPGTRIEVRAYASDGRALCAVADQGKGVAAEMHETIFEPFKGQRHGTAGEKSTGLGLAIVRKIIMAHGGEVWFESKEGRGSTFYVSLPLASAPAGPLESDTSNASPLDLEAALMYCGGSERELAAKVGEYRRLMPQAMGKLKEALAGGNGRALAHGAYRLNRILGELGAGGALEAALMLERSGRSGRLDEAGRHYAILERELERLDEALVS